MKKTILFAVAAMLMLAACNNIENPENKDEKLAVNPKEIKCPDAGGEYIVALTAQNSWTAKSDNAWVTVSPAQGEGNAEVRIKISANKESAESKSKVTFTDGENVVELPITRAAKAAPRLQIISETDIFTPRDGGTYTIQIESNIQWQVDKTANWITLDKGMGKNNGSVTMTIAAATIPEETTAKVTVSQYTGSGAEAQVITITRGGTDATSLSVDLATVEAPAEGGTYNIKVSSNARWKVSQAWDTEDWISVFGTTENEGDGSFGITVEPATTVNPSQGIITITEMRNDGYVPVVTQVLVTRAGKPQASLSVDPTAIYSSADGGDFPIEIKSNYSWTATTNVAKIVSLSSNSGSGDATLVVTVKPAQNNDGEVSLAKVYIKSDFGGEQAVINVRRAAKDKITLMYEGEELGSKLETSYAGGEYIIQVASNTVWEVVIGNSDIATANPTSGEGNGQFAITVNPAQNSSTWVTVVHVKSKSSSLEETFSLYREGLPEIKYTAKPFDIGDGKKVIFSQGNLQYQPSTKKWRFAPTQYHYCGAANKKIDDAYTGWIDLFGFGTGTKPTLKTDNDNDYLVFNEWGNNVSNAQTGQWRTLTSLEWTTILGDNYGDRRKMRGYATVVEVPGMLLLPDGWTPPTGFSFDYNATSYETNKYSGKMWLKMEEAGAVFLPAAGFREKVNVYNIGERGHYWSSSTYQSNQSFGNTVDFWPGYNTRAETSHKYNGNSVRLVQEVK